MNSSLLINLLKSLTANEKSFVDDMLRFKYQRKRQDVYRLYEALARGEASKKIEKKQIFERLYSGEKFNDGKLRKSIFVLKSDVEDFLAQYHMPRDASNKKLFLGKLYAQKGLTKQFEKTIESIEPKADPQKDTGQKWLLEYQLHQLRFDFDSKKRRQVPDYLPDMISKLKYFYMIEVIKWACQIQSLSSISSADYALEEIEDAVHFAKSNQDIPSFKIYYLIYQSSQPDASHQDFSILKKSLNQSWSSFTVTEVRQMYLLSINHCIRRLNQGSKAYLQEAFDLYEDALKHEILYENEKLSPFTYKNIMNIALALGKNDWAFSFLNKEKERLEKNIQENTFAANLATYYYKIGSLRKAIDLLREVQFFDVFDNLKYRTLLARIYFELGEHQALEHHLESFASYLYRQKKLGYHKSLYQNLIGTMRKILRSNLRDKSVRDKLMNAILTNDQLAEKDWFVNQLTVNN